MSRRVVITGMGIWSCIGQDLPSVTESLRQGRSGIVFDQSRIDYGLQSGLVGNVPRPDLKPLLPRKFRATMSEDAEYAYMAARQAFEQAGISDEYLKENEVGIIWGSDGGVNAIQNSLETMNKYKDALMLGANPLLQCVASSAALNISAIFNLRGINMSIGAACSSSNHAIGVATSFIRSGLQNTIIVGGSTEVNVLYSTFADSTQTTSLNNNEPQKACKPYDVNRDGIVLSGGGAALILENYETAIARNANILAEVIGYGFSSNGNEDIALPSVRSEYLAMKRSIDDAKIDISNIDCIVSGATANLLGDINEALAISQLLKDNVECKQYPRICNTESITGHENWMAGASKSVYAIIMMQNNFIAPNINLETVITEAKNLNVVKNTTYTTMNTVLVNASGIGGTNSSIVIKKYSSNNGKS